MKKQDIIKEMEKALRTNTKHFEVVSIVQGDTFQVVAAETITKKGNSMILYDGREYYFISPERKLLAKSKNKKKLITEAIMDNI